jgi:hypothetical protein
LPNGFAVGEPTGAELWRCVEATVRDVLLPAIGDEWARAAAVQLVGLARYAASRPPDPGPDQAAELAGVLDRLGGNPLVAARWNGDRDDVANIHDTVSRLLVAAVGDGGPEAAQIRDELRSVVIRQLDDELVVAGPLVAAFRGQLDA